MKPEAPRRVAGKAVEITVLLPKFGCQWNHGGWDRRGASAIGPAALRASGPSGSVVTQLQVVPVGPPRRPRPCQWPPAEPATGPRPLWQPQGGRTRRVFNVVVPQCRRSGPRPPRFAAASQCRMNLDAHCSWAWSAPSGPDRQDRSSLAGSRHGPAPFAQEYRRGGQM